MAEGVSLIFLLLLNFRFQFNNNDRAFGLARSSPKPPPRRGRPKRFADAAGRQAGGQVAWHCGCRVGTLVCPCPDPHSRLISTASINPPTANSKPCPGPPSPAQPAARRSPLAGRRRHRHRREYPRARPSSHRSLACSLVLDLTPPPPPPR